MTSYTSEIMVGSAIVAAALGVAAYMVVQEAAQDNTSQTRRQSPPLARIDSQSTPLLL
jgi:hypothetical protein